jgi:hypothetical protein
MEFSNNIDNNYEGESNPPSTKYIYPKLGSDTTYKKPKKTITDLMQSPEEINKKLEGFNEIDPTDLSSMIVGDFVRYITFDKVKKIPLFRTGGNVIKNCTDYVVLRGANKYMFSVQKYITNENNEIIFNTRFFKKINIYEAQLKDMQFAIEKSHDLIKKQTKLLQKQQDEIRFLKKELDKK